MRAAAGIIRQSDAPRFCVPRAATIMRAARLAFSESERILEMWKAIA
jgi:hypothetical protein